MFQKYRRVIFIGVGETEDPFPDEAKTTMFWVHAGPCPKCGQSTRFLLPKDGLLALICNQCQERQDLGIGAQYWGEVTYVHWCRESRFASDEVSLPQETVRAINALTADFDPRRDTPGWGVRILGGKCCFLEKCTNSACPYHENDNNLPGKVVPLSSRKSIGKLRKIK